MSRRRSDQNRQNGRRDGLARRDDAHTILKVRRAAVLRDAQRALLKGLLVADTMTADDVRDCIHLPADIKPVCLGAAPSPLAKAGLIRRIGYEQYCRPEAHARPISVWTLADRPGAIAWLDVHPPMESPALGSAERDEILF